MCGISVTDFDPEYLAWIRHSFRDKFCKYFIVELCLNCALKVKFVVRIVVYNPRLILFCHREDLSKRPLLDFIQLIVDVVGIFLPNPHCFS